MKENIVTILLAVLVVMFGLNSLYKMVKVNQFEAEAIEMQTLAEEMKQIAESESIRAGLAEANAVEMMLKAESQMKIARAEMERADSLQQQLDKCK